MTTLIKVNETLSKRDKRRLYTAFWKHMMPVVADAVVDSYASASMREPTRREVMERTELAKKMVDQLRWEFGWSTFRIRDHLGYLLRAKLAGIELPIGRMLGRSTW